MTNSCIPIFAPLVKNKTRFLQVKITLVPRNIMKYRKLTKTSEISRCFRYLEIIVSRIFSSHCPRFPLWLCLFRKPGFGHCYKHHAKHEELPVSAVICKGARRHLWMPETHINPFSGKYLIRKPLKTMGSVGLGGWQEFQGASELSSLLETDFWRALAQQTTFLGVHGIPDVWELMISLSRRYEVKPRTSWGLLFSILLSHTKADGKRKWWNEIWAFPYLLDAVIHLHCLSCRCLQGALA